MKLLINHSNHSSSNWEEAQKLGRDKIVDLPFPNIDPNLSDEELHNLIQENLTKIMNIIQENGGASTSIMLQGEYTYCYKMYDLLSNPETFDITFVIPTTHRTVVEGPDGTKLSVFKFVKRRHIYPLTQK